MKLWALGASGLVGSALKRYADVATARSEVDIASIESLRLFAKQHKNITHIVNCAALSLVDLAEVQREEAWLANAKGPENLGILAKEIGARIIHLSTDYVFAGSGNRPLKEDNPTIPCNHYGATKLEGEKRLMEANESACIIRPSWIFGKGGKNFVAKLLELFREKEEIQLTDDHWGRPTFVHDLVKAILEMKDTHGIYHFANHGATNKYEFGCAMLKKAKMRGAVVKTERVVPVSSSTFPSVAKRPRYSVFDTSKIETHLKWKIRTWEEALEEYFQED